MERNENFQNESINDGVYNNFRNILLIVLILIFAILIERTFPDSILKNIYFIITIIIIVIFLFFNLSQENINKIKSIIPFFSPNKKDIQKLDKEKMDKIKNVYKKGYMNSKRNSYINDYKEQNQYLNPPNNYYYNNMKFKTKNDEYLANKISNINKINDTTLMDSFNQNNRITNYGSTNNYYGNNNYNNNQYINNYDTNNKITRLPDSSSIRYESNNKKDYLGNKNLVANPFNNKINNQNSKDSSGNYYLFSMNKNQLQNNIIYNNPYNKNKININQFNPIDNISSTNNIFESMSIINKIPKNKEVSYNNYQALKSRYENTQVLEQNNNSIDYSKFIDKMPRELMNVNNSWILKMKIFISKNLIPNIITKHDNNISNLNAILSSLGIKIISSLPENDNNDYLDVLNKKLSFINSNQINEYKGSNLLLQNLRNHLGNNMNNNNFINNYNNNENKNMYFPSLNNFSSFLNESRGMNELNNNDNKLKKVFFGDTNKIKQILILIENKINEIELKNNNNEYQSNSYYKRQIIIKTVNSNNNPFLKKEDTKILDDYIKNINDSNASLNNLQRLLYERIIINERLFPKELFDKKNEMHALLVIEYAIERFKQLNQNFDNYGNGSRGGEFLNDNWCSLLPTDSQLIAHLVVNYIENIYLINNGINQQKFLLSFPSNYIITSNDKAINENNKTSIFLYQVNPHNVEPMFNVVYKNILIPTISGNMNLFHALVVYFYLLNIKSPMFVMNLGIHNFIDNITK